MPLLNYPKLELPVAAEVAAFRAIDKIVRTDPVCKRTFNRSIYSWTGDALDDAEPGFDTCPWMRLSPSPDPSGWGNSGQQRFPMTVGIELASAGTNIDNLMNLFGIVRYALFPQDPAQFAAVRAVIQAANITQGEFTRAAYAVRTDEKSNKILKAAGNLELVIYVNT